MEAEYSEYFEGVKVIGFDLDQTLYPKSEEIDLAIQSYIWKRIAEKLGWSLEKAGSYFKERYPKLSASQILIGLGFSEEEAKDIVQEALENAEISEFLKPNPEVRKLLEGLKGRYKLSLITSNSKENAERKLRKLEIPLNLFDFCVFAEYSKSSGEAFKVWFEHFKKAEPSLKPENFLYVGDNYFRDAKVPLSLGMKAALVNVKKKDPELGIPQFYSLLDIGDYLK